MKNLTIKIAFALMALAMVPTANAQSVKSVLTDVLGKVTKDNKTLSTVADVLIGTTAVKSTDIVGTWTYSQPAVAFESEDALTKVGGAAMSSKLESQLGKQLTKVGISQGKLKMTFNKDGSFSAELNKKTVNGKYTISGSTITLTKNDSSKTKVQGNIKLGTTLQITFKADKLLTFAQQFGSIAGKSSSTLKTATTLLNKYKGLQLGMRFTK